MIPLLWLQLVLHDSDNTSVYTLGFVFLNWILIVIKSALQKGGAAGFEKTLQKQSSMAVYGSNTGAMSHCMNYNIKTGFTHVNLSMIFVHILTFLLLVDWALAKLHGFYEKKYYPSKGSFIRDLVTKKPLAILTAFLAIVPMAFGLADLVRFYKGLRDRYTPEGGLPWSFGQVMAVGVWFLVVYKFLNYSCQQPPKNKDATQAIAVDVAIVGGGGSGGYAAVQLRENYGKKIVVIEKQKKLGGHAESCDQWLKYTDILLPTSKQFPRGDKVPSDLLLSWYDFVRKYKTEAASPSLWETVVVDLNTALMIDVWKAWNPSVNSFQPAPGDNTEIWQKAAKLLGKDVLYESEVVSTKRTKSGVKLDVRDKDGHITKISAKRLLITIGPETINPNYFDLSSEEVETFHSAAGNRYFTGIASHPSLPAAGITNVVPAAIKGNYLACPTVPFQA
ncbi:amine oxidase [Fusarium napiforme]|uniref:Amine oxidase n=1 Tax=Fusarium napiforme TaxID=42672 RepID=A0A8H5NKC9_9HYPO|nr:amine oxidase [Fusarium napiforme]